MDLAKSHLALTVLQVDGFQEDRRPGHERYKADSVKSNPPHPAHHTLRSVTPALWLEVTCRTGNMATLRVRRQLQGDTRARLARRAHPGRHVPLRLVLAESEPGLYTTQIFGESIQI